jgi:hypothetical protein
VSTPGQAERSLAIELTAVSLARVAPDELVVLDETAAEYFDNPERMLRQGTEDSPLGAGIPVEMITPYLLAAAQWVLPLLATFVGEIVKGVAVDITKDPLSATIRRLFKRNATEPPGPLALTRAQTDRVRQAVVDQCFRAGLPSGQAALLADATVGSLHTQP